MGNFNKYDPSLKYKYYSAIRLDDENMIQGDPSKQKYSVSPRTLYIDAVYKCKDCSQEFIWTADEQKAWFESYFFWVYSEPRHCKNCRANRRRLLKLQKEYDDKVAEARCHGSIDQKSRIVQIINELNSSLSGLPEKMTQTKELFIHQIKKQSSK